MYPLFEDIAARRDLLAADKIVHACLSGRAVNGRIVIALREIARLCGMSSSNTSVAVERLVAYGLLDRAAGEGRSPFVYTVK